MGLGLSGSFIKELACSGATVLCRSDCTLCYGDDTPFDKGYLDQMVAIAKSLTYDPEWRDGDVAVADNSLVMHGRLPYSGERKRKVLVVLGLE